MKLQLQFKLVERFKNHVKNVFLLTTSKADTEEVSGTGVAAPLSCMHFNLKRKSIWWNSSKSLKVCHVYLINFQTVMVDLSNRVLILILEMTYLSLIATIWKQLDEFFNPDPILSRDILWNHGTSGIFSRQKHVFSRWPSHSRNTFTLNHNTCKQWQALQKVIPFHFAPSACNGIPPSCLEFNRKFLISNTRHMVGNTMDKMS